MKQEYDLTRSKRAIPVPDEKDLARQHMEVDRLGRLLQDADVVEECIRGDHHAALVAISKKRVLEIVRKMLTVDLTPDQNSVAFHNDTQGRLRERMLILDELDGVISAKGWLAKTRETLIATVKRWGEKQEMKQGKE